MSGHVLIVSQRMDRTGAPTQLLTLLPGLGDEVDARLTLLSGARGSLTPAALPHVDRLLVEPRALRALRRAERAVPRALARLLGRARRTALRWRVGPVDVVYVNSLISAELASAFDRAPAVVHVHELGRFAASFGDQAQGLVHQARDVLVPSPPVAEWVTGCGVPPDRVHLLPGAVPPSAFEAPTREAVQAARARIGIGTDTGTGDVPVVSAVGWIGALKGSDRFLDVAAAVAAEVGGQVRFVWVGGGSDTEQHRFAAEIAARELSEVVVLVPAIEDLRPFYAMSSVVLIASREESLSLVALESAAQATPVVAFPGAGGPDVLGAEGIVACAADDDVDSVASAVLELLVDPEGRAERGRRAREAVRAHHGVGRARSILAGVLASALPGARPSQGGRSLG